MLKSACKGSKGSKGVESEKKKGKRKVKVMSRADDFQSLSDVGGLPPSEESDEGRVEREVDVLSEPPEIDTSRAEERPSRIKRFGVLCFCFPFLIAVAIVIVSLVASASQHSKCSSRTMLQRLSSLNHTNIEGELERVYRDCVG